MVNVGIIGQGFIGKMHLAVLRKSELAKGGSRSGSESGESQE
jgi:predicted dehydrogenase